MSSSGYIHGSAPEEQQRLSLLNNLINDSSLREMNLRGGESVLDLGSGLGQFTRLMARAAGPAGRVVGVERDPAQIAECRRLSEVEGLHTDIREGDVTSLPLRADEWGTFDVAHARFLLEHVRNPLAVVKSMVRAVHPRGRVILEDDDHDIMRFWPEPPGAYDFWRAYYLSFEKLGNDPYIGRKLAALLLESGARPQRVTWIHFGACAGEELFPLYVENLIGVVTGAREQILAAGLLDRQTFDNAITSLLAWSKRPDVTLWYARAWGEGRK